MAGPGAGEVWLFKDEKFGGTCWKFNESKPAFEDLGCNNKVSSLRVGPGTTAILFANSKFGGASVEFNQDASTLGKINDKSSSIKVLREAPAPATPGPGEVYLYRDSNFEAFVWRANQPIPDLAKIGAKSAISSVRVGPGTEAIFYNEPNFSGKVLTVSKNLASLGDWNDKAVSVKIFKSA